MRPKILIDKKEIVKKISDFFKGRNEILFAYIFGSFTEDETFNDVDIGIYLNPESLPTEVFYEVELSNQLEKILKIPVDIVILNKTSDFILHRATKGIMVKNNNDQIRTDYITKHWKMYWDFKDKIREQVMEMKRGNR